jgi:hypothetical protein
VIFLGLPCVQFNAITTTVNTPLSPRSVLFLLCLSVSLAQPAGQPIDFNRARQLIERERAGETLPAAEKAYVERARAERAKQQQVQKGQKGGAPARPANQRSAPALITPLTDLGATGRYEDQDGGLYGAGRNTPPEALRAAATRELARIQPLDAQGRPAADGSIGFVALSMSNATQEFSFFKRLADASPLKHPSVTIVDCAQGGQAMAEWGAADARPWQVARERLAAAGVTPAQVQVAWVKLANKGPSGSLEEHGRKLERDTLALLQHAKTHFPNLRIAYLGSRTYGGYATGGLNPEPYAFESAFAARWLMQRQMNGDAALHAGLAPLLGPVSLGRRSARAENRWSRVGARRLRGRRRAPERNGPAEGGGSVAELPHHRSAGEAVVRAMKARSI